MIHDRISHTHVEDIYVPGKVQKALQIIIEADKLMKSAFLFEKEKSKETDFRSQLYHFLMHGNRIDDNASFAEIYLNQPKEDMNYAQSLFIL